MVETAPVSGAKFLPDVEPVSESSTGEDPASDSEPSRSQNSPLPMLQDHLAWLCSDAATIVPAQFEAAPEEEVHALLARTSSLVVSALEAVDLIEIVYVSIPAAEEAEMDPAECEVLDEPSTDWDDRASTPPIMAEAIEDVLVLARMGLHSRARLLRAVCSGSSRWDALAVIGSALRTVQKSLSAVDRVVSRSEAVMPAVRFHERALQVSLEIRRRYIELAGFVLRGGKPEEHDVRDRLLSASAAISRMLGLPIAVHLRTEDRALLLTSRARLRDWLVRDQRTPEHLTDGLRLWQDVAGVVTMFSEINRREELLQHDAQLVRDVLPDVPRGALLWSTDKRASVLRRLTAMRGRSPALDALLDLPTEAVAARDLRPILEELDDMLAGVTLLDPA